MENSGGFDALEEGENSGAVRDVNLMVGDVGEGGMVDAVTRRVDVKDVDGERGREDEQCVDKVRTHEAASARYDHRTEGRSRRKAGIGW